MSALVPLMTSTGPLLDRASAGVRALMNAVSRREGEYFEEGHFSASQVKKELQDASVEAKVRALKRLLAAHASGVDVSGLLPEVVKAIAVPSLELKRLVYLFLILHAETSRGVALLSINSFQKDLADRNQIIRATALKALASIRLLEVVQLLMAALRRAAADSSPFVRRTAAQCVMKIFTLDSDQFQELQKIVLALLKDVEISVVGAALVAFRELCLRHGAADCLRYHESQLPPEQQHHEGYLQLCLEEQQQEGSTFLEGQRCLSRPPASACSENGGRDASGDAARQRTDAGRGENGVNEEQENAEVRWRTDAKLQGRWNCQKDGGRASDGGDGVRAATATDAVAATAASSKMLRRHRETGHMKSCATAATKWRNFKAQACALALLHQHYRRLQESMLQLEPFAQVVAVDLFLRYARLFFAEPAAAFRRKQQQQQKTQEAERQESEREKRSGGESKGRLTAVTPSGNSTARGARSGVQFAAGDTLTFEKMVEESSANPLPADLRLFLWNLGQLLYSESVAVVAAVAAAFYHLLPAAAWKPLVHPLLRCIYTSSVEFQEPLLHIAAALAAAAPSLFLPHFRTFFLAYNDPPCVKQGKLLVLRRLLFSPHFASAAAAAEESATLPPLLLQELCTYIRWPGDPLLLSTCFNFLVNIALRFPSGQSACMQIFVQLLDTPPSCSLASEAILGLQVLLQQQQERPQHQQQRLQQERGCVAAGGAMEVSGTAEWTEEKASFRAAELKKKQSGGRQQLGWLVLQLAIHLSRVVQGAAARASIVWIVGEYQREVGWVAADIFRQLASSFKEEPGEVKLQILLLGLKVWALHWDNKQRLKERAQQQGRFSARGAEREPKNVTAAAETAAAAAAAGGGSESVATYEGSCSALIHNGVLPTAAAAASQVGGQQQQHQERAWLQAGAAEEAQQKAGNRACEARLQEKQPQEREEEQFHLLPPPTPEESAAAFPRIDRMLKYVCEAASFDASYDVRDVARLYFALSRLALASERETFHGSRGSSDNRESSPTSSYNRSSTSSSGNGSRCNTSHNPLNTPTENSNNDKGSKPHYVGDSRSIGEGRSEATAAGEKEGNVPHVLEELAGCGGQMFKNASPKALMDMSNFAQKYMRTLAKGPARGGQRSKPRPQHSLSIRHPGGALAGTAAAAAAPSLESEKKSESAFYFPSERGNSGDRNSTMLRSRSPSTSNSGSNGSGRSSSSGASTADDCPSSCMGEEQEARENFAGQSSALLLGSLSELLGERMRGYIDLPPFAVADSSDELRRVEQTAAPPELAQCLMRGRAAAAAGGERNSTLSTNFYMDVQDVKAISSEDIVVKRSAAALMGRDGNAKAEFTPLDLDSFYAEDLQSNGVAGVVPSVLQNVHDAPAAAPFATALTPTSATSVQGNANSYPPAPASNTLFSSASVIASETFPREQQEEHLQQQQQQSLWDMFGEAHVSELHNGERVVQQRQQNSEGQSMAQYDDKVASDFLSVDGALEAGCVSVMADQVRGRGGGVAIAGEDEESD